MANGVSIKNCFPKHLWSGWVNNIKQIQPISHLFSTSKSFLQFRHTKNIFLSFWCMGSDTYGPNSINQTYQFVISWILTESVSLNSGRSINYRTNWKKFYSVCSHAKNKLNLIYEIKHFWNKFYSFRSHCNSYFWYALFVSSYWSSSRQVLRNQSLWWSMYRIYECKFSRISEISLPQNQSWIFSCFKCLWSWAVSQ